MECLQEVQWHADASRGSFEVGIEVLNVWALQRQCAVNMTVSEVVDILLGVTIGLVFLRRGSIMVSWGWRSYMQL